jgi:hypothetical protein
MVAASYTYDVAFDGYVSQTGVALTVSAANEDPVVLEETLGAKPFNLKIEVDQEIADLTWNNADDVPLQIFYYDQSYDLDWIDAIYQDNDKAYGVKFDLTQYPDASLTSIDFHHTSWGLNGNWNYNVFVYDLSGSTPVLKATIPSVTTGNDKWEEVLLDGIEGLGGKNVGIFVQPLGNSAADAYPDLTIDNVEHASTQSYILTLNDLSLAELLISDGWGGSVASEFVFDLWILTDQGVKSISSFQEYEVFLTEKDGTDLVSVGTTTDLNYTFTDLHNGHYTAGVRALYETAATETTTIEFDVTDGLSGINYANASSAIVYTSKGYATVEVSESSDIRVLNVLGQVISSQKSKTGVNSIALPAGAYVIQVDNHKAIATYKVVVK